MRAHFLFLTFKLTLIFFLQFLIRPILLQCCCFVPVLFFLFFFQPTYQSINLSFKVAAQVTLHRSSQMSKGEAKRQAKAAAKRDKKQARQQGKQQQQQCDVDGGSSGGGGGCGGTIVGGGVCGIMGKSFPVPASMLAPHSSIHSSSASSFSSSLTPNRSSSSSTSSSPSLLPSVLAMPDLEREHVQKLYDRCASQWHGELDDDGMMVSTWVLIIDPWHTQKTQAQTGIFM